MKLALLEDKVLMAYLLGFSVILGMPAIALATLDINQGFQIARVLAIMWIIAVLVMEIGTRIRIRAEKRN